MTTLKVPWAYAPGYEKARRINREMADNYIAHTWLGDEIADAMMEDLSSMSGGEAGRIVNIIMNGEEARLNEVPDSVRALYNDARVPHPAHLYDKDNFQPGIRAFHRSPSTVVGGLLAGTLIEGFSTAIAESFLITGRLRDQGIRRLAQNNRHVAEIFLPKGLEVGNDGWRTSVRLRIVHARIRNLLYHSDEWDYEQFGMPLSAAHMGFAITAFSARLLKHMSALGVHHTGRERESFMSVWRYTGHLMGIPDSILFLDEEHALKLFEVGLECEPDVSFASIIMANSLINSAPYVLGLSDTPEARREIVEKIYKMSRALIGNELADKLNFPKSSTFMVLFLFRLENSLKEWMARLRPNMISPNDLQLLMDISAYDPANFANMPDHVFAEQSSEY